MVEKLRKSVKISQSYLKNKMSRFYGSLCIYLYSQQCAENKEKKKEEKNTVLTVLKTNAYIQHDFLIIIIIKDFLFYTRCRAEVTTAVCHELSSAL